MTNHYCARNENHQNNMTGDGTVSTIGWDQCLSSDTITYNSTSKQFRVYSSGLYQISWAFYVSNLNSNNTCACYWIHGGANSVHSSQEPYAYNGNPYAECNLGGMAGATGYAISVNGSMGFYIDIDYDPFIRVAGGVAGNATKNVGITYDGYFNIIKVG